MSLANQRRATGSSLVRGWSANRKLSEIYGASDHCLHKAIHSARDCSIEPNAIRMITLGWSQKGCYLKDRSIGILLNTC